MSSFNSRPVADLFSFFSPVKVATAAAKQNEKVGEIVAKAIMKVGTQGLVFTTVSPFSIFCNPFLLISLLALKYLLVG